MKRTRLGYWIARPVTASVKYSSTRDPFNQHWVTLIPSWISDYIHFKVWGEINYPFPNFNGATVEVWEWISNFIPHFTWHVITHPCWDQSYSVLVFYHTRCGPCLVNLICFCDIFNTQCVPLRWWIILKLCNMVKVRRAVLLPFAMIVSARNAIMTPLGFFNMHCDIAQCMNALWRFIHTTE